MPNTVITWHHIYYIYIPIYTVTYKSCFRGRKLVLSIQNTFRPIFKCLFSFVHLGPEVYHTCLPPQSPILYPQSLILTQSSIDQSSIIGQPLHTIFFIINDYNYSSVNSFPSNMFYSHIHTHF